MPKNPPHPARRRSVLLATEFYIRAMHEGVARYARQAGWSLDQRMAHSHKVPADWSGDGVIACISTSRAARKLASFSRPTVATIAVPPGLTCPIIRLDDRAAGRLAAEHLMGRGFRRLAFFSPATHPVVNDRGEGFRQAVESAGHEFIFLDWGRNRKQRYVMRVGMRRWLVRKLRELGGPLGVMASSDPWAVEVIEAAADAGLRVPQDVAVVGVDNDPMYGEVAPVPVTSVDNNLHAVGYEAAALLDRIMSGRGWLGTSPRGPGYFGSGRGVEDSSTATPILIPPRGLVARRSTDVLAVEDPDVAKALAYIFENYSRPIRVAEIAREVALTPRWLQTRFRRTVGKTPARLLADLRLEKARQLLHTTDDKVELIARRCGFSTGKYMADQFLHHLGKSPRAFRQQHAEG